MINLQHSVLNVLPNLTHHILFFTLFLQNSDYVDVHIGYEFVNVLYRDSDETLGVDINLINDIREQNGGGGEPLVCEGDDKSVQ